MKYQIYKKNASINEDLKDASDGIRTRASFFRRTDLPGTPYISILPEYINTRLRASPHQCNLKSNLANDRFKASQEQVKSLERPSFVPEAYQRPKSSISCNHSVRLLQVNNLIG